MTRELAPAVPEFTMPTSDMWLLRPVAMAAGFSVFSLLAGWKIDSPQSRSAASLRGIGNVSNYSTLINLH